MKRHVRIYFVFFDYSPQDFRPCEVCGERQTDVHHIDARGMGGRPSLDVIENLMGLCRRCHDQFGDKEQWMEWLMEIHVEFMETQRTFVDVHGVNLLPAIDLVTKRFIL